MGRLKAKQKTHAKTTSEKLLRLTFFSAKNQDEGRKLAPKLSNGLPNLDFPVLGATFILNDPKRV